MYSIPLLQCRISFLKASRLQNQFNLLLKFYSDEDLTASGGNLFQHLSISIIREFSLLSFEILFCRNAVYQGLYHTVFTTDHPKCRTLYLSLVNFSLFQIIILSA